MIGSQTSVHELAVIVSSALEAAGIVATLSGGAAVTLYADNEYQSADLDFVTNARADALLKVLEPLGFTRHAGARHFEHPNSNLFLEFPPGPLAFGETTVPDDRTTVMNTAYGPLRIVTPTQSVMDRLTAFAHWKDRQSFDQALMVIRRQEIDWAELSSWAAKEGVSPDLISELRQHSSGG